MEVRSFQKSTNPKGWSFQGLYDKLNQTIYSAIQEIYDISTPSCILTPSKNKADVDFTLNCWSLAKTVRQDPNKVASELGEALRKTVHDLSSSIVSIQRGQIHFQLCPSVLAAVIFSPRTNVCKEDDRFLIEFSSPNTNKPQHLGHVRNNVLGESISRILQQHHDVIKVNLINDRGIHICKSMVAYRRFGQDETPENKAIKGDHFVGHYYVNFEKCFQEEYREWLNSEPGKQRFEEWKRDQGGKELVRTHAKNKKLEKTLNREIRRKKELSTELSSATAIYKQLQAKRVPKQQIQDSTLKKIKLRSALNNCVDKIQKAEKQRISDVDVFKRAYQDIYFNTESELGLEARDWLLRWEHGDEEVRKLWATMNTWVLEGFERTYRDYGVSFHLIQKESETYVLGKKMVHQALERGLFEKSEEPGSQAVFCDLENVGLSQKGKKRTKKYLLRDDGTTIYTTQDLGTAVMRFDRFHPDRMIYVVADEQKEHFKELFTILSYLKPALKGRCVHLSYGMVHLPQGRMKSREGTVVDADCLLQELKEMAAKKCLEQNPSLPPSEIERRSTAIALAAIKFYLLIVDPSKTVCFDPEESLKFTGRTGPYMLYSYARIQSILRKAGILHPEDLRKDMDCSIFDRLTSPEERLVLRKLMTLTSPCAMGIYQKAAQTLDPSKIAEGIYAVAKAFSGIAQKQKELPIVCCKDPDMKHARLLLTYAVGCEIQRGLHLLGIETIDKM